MPLPSQFMKNRRGSFVIGLIVLAVVLLFGAIGLGWLGDVDTGKITGLPVTDNRM